MGLCPQLRALSSTTENSLQSTIAKSTTLIVLFLPNQCRGHFRIEDENYAQWQHSAYVCGFLLAAGACGPLLSKYILVISPPLDWLIISSVHFLSLLSGLTSPYERTSTDSFCRTLFCSRTARAANTDTRCFCVCIFHRILLENAPSLDYFLH